MGNALFVVGLSWRTAPVALREQLAFRDDDLPVQLAELLKSDSISEACVLSTCNRVEIYGATSLTAPASAVTAAAAEARRWLASSRGVSGEELSEALYEHTELDAVRHLFRVASAVDSMVVGEAQILGQLKAAYGISSNAGASAAFLNRCLERAFGVAKRVRSETGIARGAANVSTVAVDLARRVFGDLNGRTVLVVGAGKMSALAARHLRADGAGSLLVTNRSPEKAQRVAAEVGGTARPWEQLDDALCVADVVISSTGAEQPIFGRKLMKYVMKRRKYQPLVMIDIAVPRDADADVGDVDGVYLFNMDDLERVVAQNLKARTGEAAEAIEIVEAELENFEKWLRSQGAVPTIRALREHFLGVARAEVDKAVVTLGNAQTPEQREQAMRRLGELIANKLLHKPMTALKHGDDELDSELLVRAAHRLFELDLTDGAEPEPSRGAVRDNKEEPA